MGFRVIKTAIATVLAIFIAEWVGLPSPLSAGLLAILGVDVTRKRSVKTVTHRYVGSLLALILGAILFQFLGFKVWVLALYILIAFPIISRARLKEGIVTSTVVVFHIFNAGSITFDNILNEIISLTIGLGSATVVNLIYMPKVEEQIAGIRQKVDNLFSVIFMQIEHQLRDVNYAWSGGELLDAEKAIQEGIAHARRALENQLLRPDEAWLIYFYMRKEQLESIERMIGLLSHVYQQLPQGEKVAQLFNVLSEDVKNSYYTGRSEKMLKQFLEEARKMDLPANRTEFEVRSAILQLCRELDQFLVVAKKDKQRAVK